MAGFNEAPRSPLRDAQRVIRRHLALFLTVSLLAPAAVLVWSLTRDDEFSAFAEVLITRTSPAATLTGGEDPLAYAEEDRLTATEATLANTPTVAESAVRRAGTDDLTGNELLDKGGASPERSTDVLAFVVNDGDPERAERLATSWAHAFSEFRRNLDEDAIRQARQSVDARLAALRRRGLGSSQAAQNLAGDSQELLALQALQTTSARVIREADDADKVSPTPVRHTAMAAVAGLFLALLLVFLRDALDSRVRRADEVADLLETRVLGRLPAFRLTRSAPLLREDANDPFSEGLRTIRANLETALALGGYEHPIVLVTSARRREGKSTTVAGLALAAARTGLEVIVLDLDLREPAQERLLGADAGGTGLADVLAGRIAFEDALVTIDGTTDHGGRVSLLAAGGRAAAPSDVLDHQRFAPDVLSAARQDADLVLIDSGGLLDASDALALTRSADAAIVVSRLSRSRRDELREVRAALDASAARLVGAVVVGAASTRPPAVPPSERTAFGTARETQDAGV